jgi:hypothetical protein
MAAVTSDTAEPQVDESMRALRPAQLRYWDKRANREIERIAKLPGGTDEQRLWLREMCAMADRIDAEIERRRDDL